MSDYVTEQDPIFHITSTLGNDLFFCKTVNILEVIICFLLCYTSRIIKLHCKEIYF